MKDTEHFIRRATRGLWGQKRLDAQTELRGAVEDKVYRYRLLGLSEQDAVNAALRDLGNPAEIARELGAVHAVPQVLKLVMLAGLAGVLSLQAAAKAPVVMAAPQPINCHFDEASLLRYAPEVQQVLRQRITEAGGQAKYEANCRQRAKSMTLPNTLLKFNDVVAALGSAGIVLRPLPGADRFYQIKFPGSDWQGLNLDFTYLPASAKFKEAYIPIDVLLHYVLSFYKGQVQLIGTVNPLLQIGPAQMQLGTKENPVRATNQYSSLLYERLAHDLDADYSKAIPLQLVSDVGDSPQSAKLSVSAAKGSLFVLVGAMQGQLAMTVLAEQNGAITLPCDCTKELSAMRLVKTSAELKESALSKEFALLVYKLDASDLRNLKLAPVPAAQIKMVNP